MTSIARLSRLAALLLAPAALLAPSTHAAIINVSFQGVIVENAGGACTTFEADNGSTYILSTLGAFSAGDRVHVTGSYNDQQVGICFNTGGPTINVTSIQPAFAGVGTLVTINEKSRLTTDDGRVFVVQNGGAARASRVYVQGIVTIPSARGNPVITSNVIGPAFSEFGRIISLTPGNLRFKADSGGIYSLDRPGSLAGVVEGDAIFVEGIRGSIGPGGVTPITAVTARPAFHASGRVASTPAGNVLDPDTLILPDRYTASALAPFPAGAKVYLRGRSADDYDYGEAKPAHNVRLSAAGASYSTVGVLNTANNTLFSLSDGSTIHLEYNGNPLYTPSGSLAYVAGEISAQSPGSVTLSHNEVRIGIDAEGFLVNGFGCTPIIVFDNGGYVFPKYNAPYPVGEHVRVVGGITFDLPCADEVGLVDNSIVSTPAPCINCE